LPPAKLYGDISMENCFVEFLIERDLVSPGVAKQLAEERRSVREPIGMIAASHGLLHPNQVDAVLDHQRECKDRFGDIAVEMGFLAREQVERLVKIQEFRAAAEVGEALALAGALSCEDMARYLGAFLLRDHEVFEVMAGK
jgi:hypothetical protein